MSSRTPLFERLASKQEQRQHWKPHIFDLSSDNHHRVLAGLMSRGEVAFVFDEVLEQLEELLRARCPRRKYSRAEIDRLVGEHLGDTAIEEYGRWVFYPWSGRLVHVLPEHEYRELRVDRNRYKITPVEQRKLAQYRIGIVGLSVGKASAVTLATEGVGGEFRLADFDRLSLSNMNRMMIGAHNLGMNKATIAAREMFELDPYLKISLFPDGITEENIGRFLVGGGKLDLIIEECDDLLMKVRLRERARALRIPVIMDTNERGMIDIERFDIDSQRPIFHGMLGHIEADALKGLSTKDKVPYVLRLIGDRMSDRLIASMVEIEETVSSWPQLASGVALGGALTTDVTRRILLGEFESSGRYYVDLEKIVCDREDEPVFQNAPMKTSACDEALRRAEVLKLSSAHLELTNEEIINVVDYGVRAPSGGNCQPWHFIYRKGSLYCFHDKERSRSFLDFNHLATYMAFGALAENMNLAFEGMSFTCETKLFPNGSDDPLVFEMSHGRARYRNPAPSLLEQVPLRTTNRRLGERVDLSDRERAQLHEAGLSPSTELHLLTAPDELEEIGRILGEGDRLRFLNQQMHREMFGELRWSPAEVEATRDGIDIATLELSAMDEAGLRLLSSWGAMKLLGTLGSGRALDRPSTKAVAAASAVGLVTAEGCEPSSYFDGGRAAERVWLTATSLGLAFQPMTAITYLFARLEQGGDEWGRKEKETLLCLRGRYLNLFGPMRDRAEVLLFRVARADSPSARALRRPVDEMLVWE